MLRRKLPTFIAGLLESFSSLRRPRRYVLTHDHSLLGITPVQKRKALELELAKYVDQAAEDRAQEEAKLAEVEKLLAAFKKRKT